MNSDNHNNQIGRATRINFFGEPQTCPNNYSSQKSIYEMAFFSGNEDWNHEYSLNTASWD